MNLRIRLKSSKMNSSPRMYSKNEYFSRLKLADTSRKEILQLQRSLHTHLWNHLHKNMNNYVQKLPHTWKKWWKKMLNEMENDLHIEPNVPFYTEVENITNTTSHSPQYVEYLIAARKRRKKNHCTNLKHFDTFVWIKGKQWDYRFDSPNINE